MYDGAPHCFCVCVECVLYSNLRAKNNLTCNPCLAFFFVAAATPSKRWLLLLLLIIIISIVILQVHKTVMVTIMLNPSCTVGDDIDDAHDADDDFGDADDAAGRLFVLYLLEQQTSHGDHIRFRRPTTLKARLCFVGEHK